MELLQHTTYTNQHISIQKIPHEAGSAVCDFSLNISWEFAQQIMEIAAPFFVQLSESVEKNLKLDVDSKETLQFLQRKNTDITILALKTLRIARKENVQIHDIAVKLGLKHNLPMQSIITTAKLLQKQRTKRLQSFRNHLIIRQYKQGVKMTAIAQHFNLSRHVVNKIVAENAMRIAK